MHDSSSLCQACLTSYGDPSVTDAAGREIQQLRNRVAELESRLGAAQAAEKRLRAEEDLLRSEQLNREIVAGAREGIVIYDREFRYQLWNPFMEELTGLPARTVLGRSALDTFPHLRQGGLDQLLRRALDGETVQSPDVRYEVAESGRAGWTSSIYSPHYGAAGEIVGVIGLIRDVTERRRGEEALRKSEADLALSEERQRLALEAASAGLWDWDLVHDTGYISPRFSAILGYEPGEVRVSFESWKRLVHPDDLAEQLKQRLSRLHGSDESFSSEYRIRHKSGRYIWVATHGRVISRGPDGSAVRMMGTISDVTEKRQVQEQLAQAQRMESVGRLAGGIAHDFNNLLTVINGYGDLLMRQLQEGDPLRPWAAEIRAAGTRAASVTSQLLTISRKELGEPRPIDLNRLVGEHQAMLQRLIGEEIELVVKAAEEPARVMADPGQMHRVLMNLVVNAMEAMPSGGRLTIRLANLPVPAAMAGHAPLEPGRYVALQVSDTGTGIAPKDMERVFDPFFTTKRDEKGTGLGLSTVYGIVRQCGGSIAVHSEAGRGATFEVLLPSAAGQEEPQAAPLGVPTGSETILLVEDQETVRKVAGTALKERGYRIITASGGPEALQASERHSGPIHLLVTDLGMPGMTGTELAQRLRCSRPEMKTLFMSGHTTDLIARRGLLEAETPFLAKPFTPSALATKVRDVLGPAAQGPAILVVDDEEGVRSFFRQVLADEGYEVGTARDGWEALAKVGERRYNVVLMDLVMPEKEGIETIEALRREHPELKIVAVSGAFGGKFLKVAQALGAHATMLKPVSPEQLLTTVRGLTE